MEPAGEMTSAKLLKTWWPGTELNRRRQPFQGCALPPELPGHPLVGCRVFVPYSSSSNGQESVRRLSDKMRKTTRIITTAQDSLNEKNSAASDRRRLIQRRTGE
jgi:hypothetical protein